MNIKISNRNLTYSRGQATVEFIIACLVMIPMFFGIYYFARYSDIKQAGIQASRYAAFERTWDPTSVRKTDAVIQSEVRARFFAEQEKIQYHDNPAKTGTKDVSLWVQADNTKLINNTTDVVLSWDKTNKFTSGPIITQLDKIAQKGFNLPAGEIVKAQINIPLSNIAHFEPLKSINITLPAAVAIGSGTWNSSGSNNGSNSTCARVRGAVLTAGLPAVVTDFLGLVTTPFERSSPDFGIILPDYVPSGSLRKNNSATATSTPLNEQTWNPCNSSHKQPT